MPAMTNLLVKDDAATPIEYTFIPVTDTPISFWRTQIANVPLEGQMRLWMSSQQLKNGSWKNTLKLEVPVMETLGASGTSAGYVAPPKVAYVDTTIITQFADRRSTIADRSNALKLTLGVAQGASATTATGILNQASAGAAFSASVLPGVGLFTALVVPN